MDQLNDTEIYAIEHYEGWDEAPSACLTMVGIEDKCYWYYGDAPWADDVSEHNTTLLVQDIIDAGLAHCYIEDDNRDRKAKYEDFNDEIQFELSDYLHLARREDIIRMYEGLIEELPSDTKVIKVISHYMPTPLDILFVSPNKYEQITNCLDGMERVSWNDIAKDDALGIILDYEWGYTINDAINDKYVGEVWEWHAEDAPFGENPYMSPDE